MDAKIVCAACGVCNDIHLDGVCKVCYQGFHAWKTERNVQCNSCGELVTHVDTKAGMCDDCHDGYAEWLLSEMQDMHANGMPNVTLH